MEKASINFFTKAQDSYAFPEWGNSKTSYVYLNPQMSEDFKTKILSALKESGVPDSSIVVTSSGTSGLPKVYLFSKTTFLSAARRVAAHFQLSADDRWLCPLPLFHVGALSIGARAFMSGARLDLFSFEKWSPENFAESLKKNATTHTSLVPTQLFDLVSAGIFAPTTLKVLLLGGGRLDRDLYARARSLGWPVVPTFGMTETCGMWAVAATAPNSSALAASNPSSSQSASTFLKSSSAKTSSESVMGYFPFQSLNGVEWESKDSRLLVQSDSLFSAQLEISDGAKAQWRYRDSNSAWLSQDLAVPVGDANFFITGRVDDLKKVRGELVNLHEARESLSEVLEILPSQLDILIGDDGRPRLCLSCDLEKKFSAAEALRRVNAHCPAYLKMDRVDFVELKTPATWKEGSYDK